MIACIGRRLEKRLHKFLVTSCRPWAGTRDFGLIEALAYGSAIDHWMRYAPVVERIREYLQQRYANERVTILDVGGGPAGLASLLRDQRCVVIALDPNATVLNGNQALKVIGDGCRLPVEDQGVDIAVSVDSLEHLPADHRLSFLRELQRVARHRVILHCPMDSGDGCLQGTRYDKLFQRLHQRYFANKEVNTTEHLQWGLPTLEEIRSVFPESSWTGWQNGRTWVHYMVGARRPWWRLVNGLCYVWRGKAHDGQPPFHGAYVVVDRGESGKEAARQRTMRAKLSVVILTKNEEPRIARCLSHVQWADEIVVVDGGSQDQTVELCRQVGARVIQRPFSGSFAQERNAGLEAATGDWVLQLDADDVVTSEMRQAVEQVLNQDDGVHEAYKFRRRSIFLDRLLEHGGWTHYLPNLVRRERVRYVGLVHERPVIQGPLGVIEADVDHYFCEHFAALVDKLNRYSSLKAQELLQEQGWPRPREVRSQVVVRPLKLFWKTYMKKQGWRDGIPGLIMSLYNSWSHLVTFAKYWEAVRAPARPPSARANPTQRLSAGGVPLSVIVITRNEAANIQRCLESVREAEEIIVVDAESTDETVQLATQCGARVITRAWGGFASQKAFALAHATQDWVLSLDADESMTPNGWKVIVQIVAENPPTLTGCRIPIRTWYVGRWIHHCGWWPDYHLRLFRRTGAQMLQRTVHEGFQISGPHADLREPILHWSYPTIARHVEKINRYSSLEAQDLWDSGLRLSERELRKHLWLKPFKVFRKMYVHHQGYRDGWQGFFLSVLSAFGSFVTYVKFWELSRLALARGEAHPAGDCAGSKIVCG